MTISSEERSAALAPDDAFSALGNETRMEILQTLGEADELLSFSELHSRVGIRDSGQFNYHLDKLSGHFVRDTDDGYALSQSGQRVIEAVVSGAVTDTVVIGPTRVDAPCPYCGASVEVSYREEGLLLRCTECVGSFAGHPSMSAFGTLPEGALTVFSLPPAAVQERSIRELIADALAWTYTEMMAVANGICPRCAGRFEHAIEVCENHETDGAVCKNCGGRFAITFASRCGTCGQEKAGTIKHHLLADPRVRAFFEARGVDTLAPAWEDMTVFYRYDEEVLGTDPLEARFTFTVEGDELAVTIEDLHITDVTERQTSDIE